MTAAPPSVDPAATERYWAAVSANDSAGARDVAAALVRDGVPLPAVLDGLVSTAQRRVGALWAANTWSVAQEHAATAVSEYVVRSLRETRRPTRATGHPLLVVCAEREWHALPAMMLAATLEHDGHTVHYLGADVSTTALQGALLETAPRAALVSASLSSSLVYVRRHVEAARSVSVPVVVGGSAFDRDGVRALRLGATAFAASGADLATTLEALPTYVEPLRPLRDDAALEAYAIVAALPAFSADTVARVRADPTTSGPAVEAVADQVSHVFGAIAGALLTDDPTIVHEIDDWLDTIGRARAADAATSRALWSAVERQLADFPHAVALVRAR